MWPSSGAADGDRCVVCSQVRGDRSRGLFDTYEIGYADSDGGIDKRGFSCRARAKPGWVGRF